MDDGNGMEYADCDQCEIEANRCYFCGISDPAHNPEDCADFAAWELELA
jgi:hypothetical protein